MTGGFTRSHKPQMTGFLGRIVDRPVIVRGHRRRALAQQRGRNRDVLRGGRLMIDVKREVPPGIVRRGLRRGQDQPVEL